MVTNDAEFGRKFRETVLVAASFISDRTEKKRKIYIYIPRSDRLCESATDCAYVVASLCFTLCLTSKVSVQFQFIVALLSTAINVTTSRTSSFSFFSLSLSLSHSLFPRKATKRDTMEIKTEEEVRSKCYRREYPRAEKFGARHVRGRNFQNFSETRGEELERGIKKKQEEIEEGKNGSGRGKNEKNPAPIMKANLIARCIGCGGSVSVSDR